VRSLYKVSLGWGERFVVLFFAAAAAAAVKKEREVQR
jgi:hypothetical protein